ncbi:MAG: ASKHA domain-containing protein [Clostridiales bacterium]|nr:ASKHA domain-containing protein [Clostridiales bacterium]
MILKYRISEKDNLLRLIQKKGEYIPASCGGKGICGKCRVLFRSLPPTPTKREREIFSEEELTAGWRLACETEVTGDIVIQLCEDVSEDTMQVEAGFYGKSLSQLSSQREKSATEDRNTENEPTYAIAVDLGTTTLAAALVDIRRQAVVRTVTSVNHQRVFGADVVSRMEASNQGKGEQLKRCIEEDIHQLLMHLQVPGAGEEGFQLAPQLLEQRYMPHELNEEIPFVIAGNTTMEHLLQGYSCKSLGVAPYTPVDISLHTYKGMAMKNKATKNMATKNMTMKNVKINNMTILPGISTFVGADIVSGIVACGMDTTEKVNLLVDLGTNGEMVIGNRDRMLCTSTAAGPAFEGGNISCGVAGVEGAISSVEIQNGEPVIETIGDKEAIGLCGSGVLEIIYELRKEGYMDETGFPGEDIFENGYALAPSITFTIKDIREFQLAKSAIRAGIEVLIREYGANYEQISHVYLAGEFGQKVNVRKAVGIGLLPMELADKVIAVGNSSLEGAVMYAKDPTLSERFIHIASFVREITLAENPGFQELFMKYMYFPEIF